MAGPVHTYRCSRSARLDNLLRDYAGTHYQYDARGNLIEKLQNGKRSRLEWDLFNRLVGYSNDVLRVSYQYDALGRRLIKQSEAHWRERPGMTHVQREEEKTRLNRTLGCGATLYGWDGDTLAWEGRDDQTTHYLYEPGSFVPLAQAISRKPVLLHQQPTYAGRYDIDQDPLWTTSPEPDSLDALAWYQCDHLGTPQELTDAQGEIVWSAQYKAWGVAKEAISNAAQAAGIRNPIRFQGQYLDQETGLHYNRHRYYDPDVGRFIGKDPIGFAGGLNVYQYADNPVGWIDPFGLSKASGSAGRKPVSQKQNQNAKCPCRNEWEVKRFDRVCSGKVPGVGYAKFVRDPGTGMWWSADQTEHGNSAWKVFDKNGVWVADADAYGDYMNKHKIGTGKNINFDTLKCKDSN